jgi:biopolymer transport protein ExbD
MAMSVGGDGGKEKPMSDINTTPLVDVMLVLLIIFLIAIPVVIQTVDDLTIPVIEFEPTETKAENVLLSVATTDAAGLSPGEDGYAGSSPNGECRVYVNVTPVDDVELLDIAVKRLEAIIETAGGVENLKEEDLPEVHIRGDINAPYRCVGGAIFTMQRAGFAKVGFISSPIDLTAV